MGRLHPFVARPGCSDRTGPFRRSRAPVRSAAMSEPNPLADLRERIAQALRDSPAQDIEKNLHALLGALFDRLDLAARADLDVQKKLLERAQAKLAALEARV